jgi:arabinofuranosyltransferase
VPFFSELYTIDMLGLNDKHIGKMKSTYRGEPGHTKYDPDYVLARKPDLIAAWINPQMDMGWGMTLQKYAPDYALKYLVNLSRVDMGTNVVDVTAMTNAQKMALMAKGYTYGVLLRKN